MAGEGCGTLKEDRWGLNAVLAGVLEIHPD